jgi:hypothetical protein
VSRLLRIGLMFGVLAALLVDELEDVLDQMLRAVGDRAGRL